MISYYKALRALLIPNGPGQVPSSTRVGKDEVFDLDGTEPVDVGMLLRIGAIIPWHKPKAKEGERK